MGRNCRFLQGAETGEESVRAMREAVENKVSFRGLVQNYRKDGNPFCNALSITPMRDEAGEVTHFLGSLNDVPLRASNCALLRPMPPAPAKPSEPASPAKFTTN